MKKDPNTADTDRKGLIDDMHGHFVNTQNFAHKFDFNKFKGMNSGQTVNSSTPSTGGEYLQGLIVVMNLWYEVTFLAELFYKELKNVTFFNAAATKKNIKRLLPVKT